MNNEQLIKRIEALEKAESDRKRQQITYPLDEQSIEALNHYFVRMVDEYVYFGGAGDNSFPIYVATQDGKMFELTHTLIRYTADPTSDFITIVDRSSYTRFVDDETVILYTTDTTPAGLSGQGLTTYHVVSAAADGFSFKLSATQGGSAINITSSGVGRQLLQKI